MFTGNTNYSEGVVILIDCDRCMTGKYVVAFFNH